MDNTFNENELPVDYSKIPPTPEQDIDSQYTPEASEPPMPQEPQPAPPVYHEVPPSTYSGRGTGRKESPYADSPYVMHHKPRPQAQPQPYAAAKPAKKVKKAQKSKGSGKKILAACLALVLAGGLCFGGYFMWQQQVSTRNQLEDQISDLQDRIAQLEGHNSTPGVPTATIPSQVPDGAMLSPDKLYRENVDSVVAISSVSRSQSFYGTSEQVSSGSGFIISDDGYVVTNAHVVEGATSITVILHDRTEYPADLVGSNSTNDVAVLKITGEVTGLKPAVLGSSSALAIGDMVAAIGNPLGTLSSTQTVGYVSGINREFTAGNTIISMLQTDAAINSGNSGGPLFNMRGEVIGITTAKYSGTTSSGASIEGIGFAIPIDDVKGMISDLINYGYVTGAYLGVVVQDVDPDDAAKYGLPKGAYVMSVENGFCAQEAGVQPKDIITKLGEHEVTSITSLTRALRNFRADDTTTITVVRGGQELTFEITLDEKPQEEVITPAQPQGEMPAGDPEEWYNYFRRYFGG